MSNLCQLRGDIFQLEQAMGQCFKNQQSNDPIDMSSLIQSNTGQQTLKLKTMKNKMSIFELKDLVTQLLQLIRQQNRWIKENMNNYKESIKLISKQLMERVQRKWTVFKTLQQQIQQLKQSQQKWIKQLKDLRLQIFILQQKRMQQSKKTQQLQILQITLSKQRQMYQKKIQMVKKQSYKTYEQNFDLQQKISSLQDEIQEQKEQYQIRMFDQIKQLDKLKKEYGNLGKINQSFKMQIENKNSNIEQLSKKVKDLENVISTQNKNQIKNQINNVNIYPNTIKQNQPQKYNLNLYNINKQYQGKDKNQQYSIERSIRSSRKSEREIKLSIETLEFMNTKSPLSGSRTPNQSVESHPLSPYMMKSIDYTSERSKSRESRLITSRRLDSRSKPNMQKSRERFDFNKIQLEIDKLKDRLESDLNRTIHSKV